MNQNSHIMTFDEKRELFDAYRLSKKRLLLFDYDGTLVPFCDRPQDAEPSSELKTLLKELSSQAENEIVIISGRDGFTLDSWFSGIGISLVAEHGAFYKRPDKDWLNCIEKQPLWKNKVISVLEKYRLLYPGSLVETKAFSVAFHYRMIKDNVRELKQNVAEDLMMLKDEFDFSIVNGSMVIEVRTKKINKGNFVTNILNDNYFDFVLAIGDDTTDEDMFDALKNNPTSYTVKVGIEPSEAKCNLINVNNVISFLEQLNQFKSLGYYK